MQVKNIFLSASVPLEERDPKYFESADVIAIRDAVIALASAVLANQSYHLIWGGHPSITPLITLVLDRYGLKMSDRVTLYQSREFERFFPPENKDVGIRKYTDKKENRAASLLEMRQHMLGDHDYTAAVFIGGMEGVEDEYALFRRAQSDTRVGARDAEQTGDGGRTRPHEGTSCGVHGRGRSRYVDGARLRAELLRHGG